MIHTRRQLLALVLALLVATPVAAASSAPAGSPAPAKPRRAAGVAEAAKRTGSRAGATPVESAEPASRRLEDVRIEGELEVPRVTFITVRKPHRFTDFTQATMVRSSRRMAAETTLPALIAPLRSTSPDTRKESR